MRQFNPQPGGLNKQAIRDTLSEKGNLLNRTALLFQNKYFAVSYELFRKKEDDADPVAIPGLDGHSIDQLYFDDILGRDHALGAFRM